MKIGHFTPSYTPITAGQVAQILREEDTLHGRLGYDYEWWSEECSDVVKVRNRALQRAIDIGCDYLCMQDSDIWSKSNIGAIAPMLVTARETGAAMVAAICGLRRDPPVANVSPSKPGEVYEASKAGTGLVLIDCEQAEKLERPWFGKEWSEDGCEITLGEDIWFCKRLSDAGQTLWVDGRVPTTHVHRDLKTLDYPGAATASGPSPDSHPAETGTQ